MKTYLVNFSGTDDPYSENDRWFIARGMHRDYETESKNLIQSAKNVGLEAEHYDFDWLKSTPEYKNNPLTFAKRPYAWAFKPVTIWHKLQGVDDGDVVIWCDSNHIVNVYPQRIINVALSQGIFAYDHTPTYYPNGCWTYRNTFKKMNCDEEKYWRAPQMHANVIGVCKNDFTMKFVEEWKNFTCDYDVMKNDDIDNFSCFVDTRDDQSVFSILVAKHNITPAMNPEMDGIIIEAPETGL
jgi:hypothetical protein